MIGVIGVRVRGGEGNDLEDRVLVEGVALNGRSRVRGLRSRASRRGRANRRAARNQNSGGSRVTGAARLRRKGRSGASRGASREGDNNSPRERTIARAGGRVRGPGRPSLVGRVSGGWLVSAFQETALKRIAVRVPASDGLKRVSDLSGSVSCGLFTSAPLDRRRGEVCSDPAA